MHNTALIAGKLFCEVYCKSDMIVLDIGGKDVNGSLRSFFEDNNMKYISVDLEEDSSVDIVVKPYERLPFETNSIDIVVSTSCFEHDPCFWITFKELCRIVKLDGLIYLNAPCNGHYHKYPGDNWRFYSDAGQALVYWSGKKMYDSEIVYPVKILETFHVLPDYDIWTDFVCVFKRTNDIDNEIVVREEIYNTIGLLQLNLNNNNIKTTSKFEFIFNKIDNNSDNNN